MKEISNSTLALMVVTAILVSVFGSFVSLSKLDQLEGVTGFATTATGKANLTVSAEASIEVIGNDVIELGTIALNQTNTSDDVDDWWRLENTGGVNISIEVYNAQTSGGTYSGERGIGPFTTDTSDTTSGCIDALGDAVHTCFQVKCNSSDSGYSCNDTYYPLWLSDTGATLIIDLNYDEGNDQAIFGVNATVPPDESAGNKELTVTFSATCTDEDAGC